MLEKKQKNSLLANTKKVLNLSKKVLFFKILSPIPAVLLLFFLILSKYDTQVIHLVNAKNFYKESCFILFVAIIICMYCLKNEKKFKYYFIFMLFTSIFIKFTVHIIIFIFLAIARVFVYFKIQFSDIIYDILLSHSIFLIIIYTYIKFCILLTEISYFMIPRAYLSLKDKILKNYRNKKY